MSRESTDVHHNQFAKPVRTIHSTLYLALHGTCVHVQAILREIHCLTTSGINQTVAAAFRYEHAPMVMMVKLYVVLCRIPK